MGFKGWVLESTCIIRTAARGCGDGSHFPPTDLPPTNRTSVFAQSFVLNTLPFAVTFEMIEENGVGSLSLKLNLARIGVSRVGPLAPRNLPAVCTHAIYV